MLYYGNHDSIVRQDIYRILFEDISYATIIKYKKCHFYLSHYPTCVGNFDDEGVKKGLWCLCGHRHTKDKFIDMDKKSYHVELDAHQNYPVSIEFIIQDIHNKVNELYKEKIQKEKEYYENGLGYSEKYPLETEILD